MNLIIPEKYDPVLTLRQTQEAIKYIRDTFQKEFGRALMLERISAPLFVQKSSGLNDNLNGVEKPVSFQISCFENDDIENMNQLIPYILTMLINGIGNVASKKKIAILQH